MQLIPLFIYISIYFQDRKFSLSFQGTFIGQFGHWQVEKEPNVKNKSPFHYVTLMQNCGLSKHLSATQPSIWQFNAELFSLEENMRLGFRSALDCNFRE